MPSKSVIESNWSCHMSPGLDQILFLLSWWLSQFSFACPSVWLTDCWTGYGNWWLDYAEHKVPRFKFGPLFLHSGMRTVQGENVPRVAGSHNWNKFFQLLENFHSKSFDVQSGRREMHLFQSWLLKFVTIWIFHFVLVIDELPCFTCLLFKCFFFLSPPVCWDFIGWFGKDDGHETPGWAWIHPLPSSDQRRTPRGRNSGAGSRYEGGSFC